MAPRRLFGLGVLATGLVCPCHVLAGLAALLLGVPLLSPAAQDGVHALYVPSAVLPGREPARVFLAGLGLAAAAGFAHVVAEPELSGRRSLLVDCLGFGFSDRPPD